MSSPESSDGDVAIDRRRLLALAGSAAAGGLAGCGSGGGDGDGGDGGDSGGTTTGSGPTSTPEPTTGAPSATTASATTTEPTAGTTETSDPPAEQTTTPEPVSYGGDLVVAPSSEVAPTDGFATVDWLAEREPEIVRVTNLDREGEGSLRAALEAEGHRIVVFEVGGVVDLATEGVLEIPPGSGSVFVAGQTAPSPGITIIRGDVVVDADDVVLQHVRVRMGDELTNTDALSVGEQGSNVIFDHCSATWGTDEVMSTGGSEQNHDVTFSNNLVAEGVQRKKATLVMDHAKRVAILGNTYANNEARHPVLKGDTTSVVANNLVFNYEAAITMAGTEEYTAVASVVGNHYFSGPEKRLVEESSPMAPRAYVEDNRIPMNAPIADDTIELLDERPVWPGEFEAMAAEDVRQHNLATTGARPADRTPHDERIVASVRDEVEGYINSQSEVGGYPDLEETERSLDPPAPGEGLADWIAQHTRAVELGEEPPS